MLTRSTVVYGLNQGVLEERAPSEAHSKKNLVFDRSIGKVRPAAQGKPLVSSAPLDWRGFLVEKHRLGAHEARDVACVDTIVLLHLKDTITVELKENGRYVQKQIEPGDLSVFPAGVPFSTRSENFGEFLLISLQRTFMQMACNELLRGEDIFLQLRFGFKDPVLEGLCLGLRNEVEEGGKNGAHYSETLATSLAVHLVRKYGRKTDQYPAVQNVPHQRIRLAMEFIHENLSNDITLDRIAASARLSPFHFSRTFKQATGLSPHQYVTHERIEHAKKLITERELSLSEVATACGFCDQSHLNKHFKKITGVTPGEFAGSLHNRAMA